MILRDFYSFFTSDISIRSSQTDKDKQIVRPMSVIRSYGDITIGNGAIIERKTNLRLNCSLESSYLHLTRNFFYNAWHYTCSRKVSRSKRLHVIHHKIEIIHCSAEYYIPFPLFVFPQRTFPCLPTVSMYI